MLKEIEKRLVTGASIASGSNQRGGFVRSRIRSGGFTIIEVLIVLAIAGLIMIVVFLAVPSLQRSGRNNGLTTDARNVVAGITTYANNNGSQLPTAVTLASNIVTIGAAGTNQDTVKVGGATAISLNGTPITNAAAIGSLQVFTGTTAVCNATATGISGTGSARNYVILYVAESGSGNIVKCVGN